MRRLWLAAAAVVGCSTSYAGQEQPEPFVSDGGVDAGALQDARSAPVDAAVTDAEVGDAGVDGEAPKDPLPFASAVVLRLETDAPNGLQANGAWRDLSKVGRTVSIATGTPLVQFSGDAGARAMVFGATGPIFDTPDTADLQFGTTDDFFVVARATIEVPLESGSGCSFHYLFSKYNTDGATAPQLRVCAPSTGRELVGTLKLGSPEAKVAVSPANVGPYGVVSFGRNLSGARIETYFAGASLETGVASVVDVSAPGSAFVIGGARGNGTGAAFGPWLGKINRLYVYHAPGGTFTAADFAAIRAFVKDVTPLP